MLGLQLPRFGFHQSPLSSVIGSFKWFIERGDHRLIVGRIA